MSEDQTAIALDVEPPPFTTLDPSHANMLSALVRTRDRRLLREFGGVDGVIRALDTDSENGILGDDIDIDARKKIFGTNCTHTQYPRRAVLVKGFRLCTMKAIKDPQIIILLVFTLVSLCFGIKDHGIKSVWPERGTKILEIVAVVIVSAVTNFWPITQSHHNLCAEKYHGYTSQVDVVRKCEWGKVPISRVVVGDVVFLKPGDKVPADGLFIDGHSFILENVITSNGNGKLERAEVGHENPFIFAGNMVAAGYSRMVVTAVGKTSRRNQALPPQVFWMMGRHAHELQNLTAIIGRLGKAFALSTFMWFLFRFCIEENEAERGGGGGEKEADIVELLIALVGMSATSAIIALTSSLEGLVLAVKSTLAYSMRSLLNDQVLIKKPALCHQVASVDTICVNKTGTLTSDFSEVQKFWLGLSAIEEVPHNLIAPTVLELLHQAIGLNTTQPRLSYTFTSSLSLTEEAICEWAVHQLSMEKESLRRSCTILEIEPFNPVNKRSGVLISKNNAIHVHRKGAVDLILPMCSHYYESTGIVNVINATTRALLEQIVRGMEENGLRCIAFAHRKTSIEEYFNFSSQKLTLLGLAGINNPVRTGVKRVVKDFQKAGITFKLLTGDSASTATFLALRGGLLEHEIQPGQVVEGKEFRDFTPEERMEKVREIRVLAKATPSDKLLMVDTLKRNKNVVAYLGGGIGDAHALQEANVGLCFGTESGAEILKACSDIVIKKKTFTLVIEILKWGRGFYDSIQTYTQFLLTATFVDLVVDFMMTIFPSGFTVFYTVATISSGEVPIPVFQLLWVKLILRLVAALSVLIKQPSEDLMSNPGRDQNEPLMTDSMQRNISAQSFYQILVLLAIHFKGKSLLKLHPNEKNTAIFNTYVLSQVFTLINAKLYDRKNIFQEIHNKKWFWGIIAIIIALEVIMVELWKSIAGTARLDARQWGLCIFMAAASTPISWLLRYICPVNIPYLSSAKGSNMKSKIE